jgi:hypothetical protein
MDKVKKSDGPERYALSSESFRTKWNYLAKYVYSALQYIPHVVVVLIQCSEPFFVFRNFAKINRPCYATRENFV